MGKWRAPAASWRRHRQVKHDVARFATALNVLSNRNAGTIAPSTLSSTPASGPRLSLVAIHPRREMQVSSKNSALVLKKHWPTYFTNDVQGIRTLQRTTEHGGVTMSVRAAFCTQSTDLSWGPACEVVKETLFNAGGRLRSFADKNEVVSSRCDLFST